MASRARTISEYPSKPVIRRAVEQARELGIDVAGYEVAPGGVIRIFGPGAIAPAPRDEFEEWEQRGELG